MMEIGCNMKGNRLNRQERSLLELLPMAMIHLLRKRIRRIVLQHLHRENMVVLEVKILLSVDITMEVSLEIKGPMIHIRENRVLLVNQKIKRKNLKEKNK